MIILPFSLQENVRSPLPLIYLFILISAYKWYMKPLTLKQTWMMTGTGLGFFLLYTCVSVVLSLFGIDKGIFVTGSFRLPVIMVSFGMFLLFDRLSFRSRIINRIAQSAFAVYLITDHPATRTLLWKHLFVLEDLYQQPFAILQILGIPLTIYFACTLIDCMRQGLFAVTVSVTVAAVSNWCGTESESKSSICRKSEHLAELASGVSAANHLSH